MKTFILSIVLLAFSLPVLPHSGGISAPPPAPAPVGGQDNHNERDERVLNLLIAGALTCAIISAMHHRACWKRLDGSVVFTGKQGTPQP